MTLIVHPHLYKFCYFNSSLQLSKQQRKKLLRKTSPYALPLTLIFFSQVFILMYAYLKLCCCFLMLCEHNVKFFKYLTLLHLSFVYLLSTYYVLSTMLGAIDTTVKKIRSLY